MVYGYPTNVTNAIGPNPQAGPSGYYWADCTASTNQEYTVGSYITVGATTASWITNIVYNNSTTNGYVYTTPWEQDATTAYAAANITWLPPTARMLKLEKLKNQISDHTIYRRIGVGKAGNVAEERSRESLKAIIGLDRYKKYLKDGFVMIHSPLGKFYQVFPGHKMTEFKEDGKVTKERLCIVFKDKDLPPTDVLIMRMMMILGDEEGLRKIANIHAVAPAYENAGIWNQIAPPIPMVQQQMVEAA